MLQDNIQPTGAARHAHRAHVAHATMVGLHSICCGAPIALMLFMASAATSSVGGVVFGVHRYLHGHEFWLLGVSALLILVGGWSEWRARRAGARGFPVMFSISVACLFFNAALIAVHRL